MIEYQGMNVRFPFFVVCLAIVKSHLWGTLSSTLNSTESARNLECWQLAWARIYVCLSGAVGCLAIGLGAADVTLPLVGNWGNIAQSPRNHQYTPRWSSEDWYRGQRCHFIQLASAASNLSILGLGLGVD